MTNIDGLPKSETLRQEALDELSMAAFWIGDLVANITLLGHFGMARQSHRAAMSKLNLVRIMLE